MDIKHYQQELARFARERDWDQYHTPKNLSMALSREASELLEIFQWLTPEQSCEVMQGSDTAECAAEEIADILIYLLRLADKLEIDVEAAITRKMALNAQKYPVALAKGNAEKYNRRKPRP